MSIATLNNTCPTCGAEESLDVLLMRMIDDDHVRRLIANVILASLPLGALVVRYLRLHKPLKQKLRMDKCGKLLAELVPDIQRTAIERNGRIWAVGLDGWKAAFQAVFDAHDKGTLTLPLEGNGYLYATLMRIADRHETAQERDTEAGRKHGLVNTTVATKGAPLAIGAVLDQTFVRRDPAAGQGAINAAPVPAALREQLADLKGRATVRTDLPTEKGTQYD